MFIVIRRSAHREERAQLMTLLCRLSGSRRPIVASRIHEQEVIALDGSMLDAQVRATMSRADAVERIVSVKTPYKLVSMAFKAQGSPIAVGDALGAQSVVIAGAPSTMIAGPCAVENKEQLLARAHAIQAAGAQIPRGGAFKPRTSPYQFQGRGVKGLQLLAEARKATGLPIITAVMEPGLVEIVAAYADGLQIGSRNMHHFLLLVAAGQNKHARPVLLKRGLCATIDAWRRSAASRLPAGNPKVILCERGIRSYDPQTRNLLDLACVPLLHGLTQLLISVDPSHATGRSELVPTMSRHRRRGTRADPGSPSQPRSRPVRWSPIDYPRAATVSCSRNHPGGTHPGEIRRSGQRNQVPELLSREKERQNHG